MCTTNLIQEHQQSDWPKQDKQGSSLTVSLIGYTKVSKIIFSFIQLFRVSLLDILFKLTLFDHQAYCLLTQRFKLRQMKRTAQAFCLQIKFSNFLFFSTPLLVKDSFFNQLFNEHPCRLSCVLWIQNQSTEIQSFRLRYSWYGMVTFNQYTYRIGSFSTV